MSVENKEIGWNNLPDIKKLLENKDIDWALAWLWEKTNANIEARKEDLHWELQIAEFTRWLNDSQTSWINDILSQFLIPQNLQA